MSSVLCDLWSDCTRENVAYLSTLSVDCQGIHFPTSEKASLNFEKKNTTVQSRVRIAKNSSFCSTSNRRAVPTGSMMTKMLDAAGSL